MNRARNVRAGTSAAAIGLVALLLVGVNYLGARHWSRGDWTKTKLFSLSQTTRKVLGGLTLLDHLLSSSRKMEGVTNICPEVDLLDPRQAIIGLKMLPPVFDQDDRNETSKLQRFN